MNFDDTNQSLISTSSPPKPGPLRSTVSPLAWKAPSSTMNSTQPSDPDDTPTNTSSIDSASLSSTVEINQTDLQSENPYELEKYWDTGSPSSSPSNSSASLTLSHETTEDLPSNTPEEEDHQIHWDQPVLLSAPSREEASHPLILNKSAAADLVISPSLTTKLFLVAGPVFMLIALILVLQLV